MQTLWTRSHRSMALPGIFISAIGILGFAIGRSAPQLFNLLPPCLFHHKTGIPCPSCGATRAAIYLCHFSFVQALWANPFFTLFFLALAFWGFASLVTLISGRRALFLWSAEEKQWVHWIVLVLFLINWLFLIFTR